MKKLFGGSRYLVESIHAKKLLLGIFSQLGLQIQDNALTITPSVTLGIIWISQLGWVRKTIVRTFTNACVIILSALLNISARSSKHVTIFGVIMSNN